MLVIVCSDQLSIDHMIESRINFTLILRQKNTNYDFLFFLMYLLLTYLLTESNQEMTEELKIFDFLVNTTSERNWFNFNHFLTTFM